ncbi:hypothetical protein P9Y62_14790 [Bacillus thuringiensis]|uniref:Uncharacterized protein n=1 Tax=Bacillus thuringiensis HD-771 TaxID=1218175 RepID=A0A9W3JEK5_BACTU|nr:hypothetical protein [Bacillus thuringiensis]EEM39692.1 hypothetical protein bthur0004_43340 [Bacillus thuringiensis serovar sotto str. T04001]AFQ18722.1 hypothetical protein BTG_26615 [Bacillus thuringiensis HD-771]MEB4891319.1 hypothetical protein [Bacillus thuringiensis]MEC2471990.1 hypothetical protein [Bacillus thuringiensis]MEC2561221.1 hypothetical protein [Bacillus thuringiensis]
MKDIYNIPVENGKYNVVLKENYEVKFLRNGEEWVNNPPGSKMLIALMGQQEDLQNENNKLREALQRACNSLGADINDYLEE